MMQNHSADSHCLEDFFTQIPIAILSKNAKLCQKVASQSANHFGIAQRTWGSRGSVSCPPCKHRSCHKRSLVASMRVACQSSVIRLSLGGHQPSADPAFVKKKAQGARLVAPKIAAQDAQNITHQLAKIGGNLNQLAHHANQGGQIDPQALKDLQNEVQRVCVQYPLGLTL